MAAGAAFSLAGKLAGLIGKAGPKLGGVLGAGRGGGTVQKIASAAASNLNKPGVAQAVNTAAMDAVPEVIFSAALSGNPLAAVPGGLANIGTSAVLGTVANRAGIPKNIRDIAGNPTTMRLAGGLAGGLTTNALSRTQSIPSQTITPDQQIQAMQLQTQLQGNQLSADSQDLLSVLNTAAGLQSNRAALFSPQSYQIPSFNV